MTRKFRLVLFLFLVSVIQASAGTSTTWLNDPALAGWAAQLPPGWILKSQGNLLIIERTKPIWILQENKINAPLNHESASQRSARIQKFGSPAQASYSVRIAPLRPVAELWSASKLPRFISGMFEIDGETSIGLEDDLTSVDPPGLGPELTAIARSLQERLALVLQSPQTLAGHEGQNVAVLAAKSRMIGQHVTAGYPEFPFSQYVDFNEVQSVAYSRKPLPGSGPWELVGRVITVGGAGKEPGRKESIEEFQIQVSSARAW